MNLLSVDWDVRSFKNLRFNSGGLLLPSLLLILACAYLLRSGLLSRIWLCDGLAETSSHYIAKFGLLAVLRQVKDVAARLIGLDSHVSAWNFFLRDYEDSRWIPRFLPMTHSCTIRAIAWSAIARVTTIAEILDRLAHFINNSSSEIGIVLIVTGGGILMAPGVLLRVSSLTWATHSCF